LWHGRGVKLVDGSSFSMPDTPANQAYFGQPCGQKPGCGFPLASIVGLFSLTTGALADLAVGPYRAGERSLWHQVWHSLKTDDIVVADRYYDTYSDIALLKERGIDILARVHQRRKVFSRGPRDQIVTWAKGTKPGWMTQQQFDALPHTLTLRIIRVKIKQPGKRVSQINLVTTLLNKKRYPARKLAALFQRRWEIETNFAHIKTTMAMDVLAAHKPETIIKEAWAHMLGYNFIRAILSAILASRSRITCHTTVRTGPYTAGYASAGISVGSIACIRCSVAAGRWGSHHAAGGSVPSPSADGASPRHSALKARSNWLFCRFPYRCSSTSPFITVFSKAAKSSLGPSLRTESSCNNSAIFLSSWMAIVMLLSALIYRRYFTLTFGADPNVDVLDQDYRLCPLKSTAVFCTIFALLRLLSLPEVLLCRRPAAHNASRGEKR